MRLGLCGGCLLGNDGEGLLGHEGRRKIAVIFTTGGV